MQVGSTLRLHEKTKWLDIGYLLKIDGMLSNFSDNKNQLKNGDVPWRRAREKYSEFLGIIFPTFISNDNIIMD